MSTEANSQSENPEDCNLDVIPFGLIWDFINDPAEAQIEADISAQIAEQLGGTSNQFRNRSRRHIERNREEGQNRVLADYFVENPVFTDVQFRRRFRMKRPLFLRIVQTLSAWSPYFRQSTDAFGKPGFSPLHKCTAAMRMLAYGTSADLFDENLRMAQSTVFKCLRKFCKGIMHNFGETYLRRPNAEDIQRLLHIGQARGFPGMLGSIDCMHWEWKNCPVGLKGQYTRGDHGVSTVMLEAVASQDTWIWHAYFGVAGSNNDLNVLNQSTLFTEKLQGRAPEVQFTVRGNEYNMGYYLADGIYPEWAAFVKTIPLPQCDKDKLYAKMQEGARKDVERAFGGLQARFAIIRNPARMWHKKILARIMYACIILHNMIIEDERDTYQVRYDIDYYNEYEQSGHSPQFSEFGHGPIHDFPTILETGQAIRNRGMHQKLKNDLVEHIWQKFGGDED